jgi:transcription-repair coupling factor (superfamily II helicase)
LESGETLAGMDCRASNGAVFVIDLAPGVIAQLWLCVPNTLKRGTGMARRRFEGDGGHKGEFGVIDVVGLMAAAPGVQQLARALIDRRRVVCAGVAGSSTALVGAGVARLARRPVVLVLAHLDEADEAEDELSSMDVDVLRLPAMEALPGETSASLELFAERLTVLRQFATLGERTPVIIAAIPALMQAVPVPARMDQLSRVIRVGSTTKLGELVAWLDTAGYRRVDAVEEPGDFALRGGILDVFPPGAPMPGFTGAGELVSGVPVRLDFFGDEVEKINEIDPGTMGSDRALPKGAGVQLICADLKGVQTDEGTCNALELMPAGAVAILAETMEVVEQGRGYYERCTDAKGIFGPPAVLKILGSRFHALAEINQFSAGASGADVRLELPASPLAAFDQDASNAVKELAALTGSAGADTATVVVCCQNIGEEQRLGELIAEHVPLSRGRIRSQVTYLHRGFAWRGEGDEPTFLVPYHELLNRFTTRRRAAKLKSSRALDAFVDFQVGDHVVHVDHGIAHFTGLTTMKPRELPGRAGLFPVGGDEVEEYLTLEFAGRTKLHVPATQIDKVQKYIGGFAGKPPLSTLGGQRWKGQKERAAESVKDLAAELLRVRAARDHMPGISYPADTAWQNEFEAEFPYQETDDQLAALGEIKKDMSAARPMDRLICGDVGFGKTELAIRAAFKAAEYGKQVAVLVPTTVLAEQHERTFRSRFAGYPFKIASISRFKTDTEAKEILQELKAGRVDVIIGTHRLLSKDVTFADLGLVIVDEEQRFGVEHKESLLRLRLTVDVLTLSATPIPRTLHMAMLGIRDISSLATPPLDRRAIVTEVIPFNERRIQQAIQRELAREGQVFFVHNRVSDIRSVADDVQRLVPEARIVVGHGQMPGHELEEVMLKFMRGKRAGGADILVSTTIIESGIDIPTANTMIINNADRFGLAELHQLRGRVGRSKHRAYCYLLLKPDGTPREVARKRLAAIEQYSMLGAGFKIAMRDLEIRGAGNLLGAEQSGHIATVGYEMYCQLLERSVKDLNNEKVVEPPSSTSIEIGIPSAIPKTYIPSDNRRLEAYRRLATAATQEQLAKFRADLDEAYGTPPAQALRLIELAELRVAVAGLGVKTVTVRGKDVVFIASNAEQLAAKLRENLKPAMLGTRGRSKEEPPATVTVLPMKTVGGEAAALAAATREIGGTAANTAQAKALSARTGSEELSEVYFRPPSSYFDGQTLLAIFRAKFVRGVPAQPERHGAGASVAGVGVGVPKGSTGVQGRKRA